MKAALLASAAFALAPAAQARAVHGTGPFIPYAAVCQYQAHLDIDGCPGSPPFVNPVLSYQNPDGLKAGPTSFFQNGQAPVSRLSRFNWNVAGVDYPVGNSGLVYCGGGAKPCSTTPGMETLINAPAYFTGYNPAVDPAGTGCGPGTNYNATTNVITCKMKTGLNQSINFSGFDLNPPGKCTQVVILEATNNNGTTGKVTFKDNAWVSQNFVGCVKASNGYFSPIQIFPVSGNGTYDNIDVDIFNNRLAGGGHNQFVLDHDGNGPSYRAGATGGFTQLYGLIGISTGGHIRTRYNYESDATAYLTYYWQACNGSETSYNVDLNQSHYVAYNHGDLFLSYLSPSANGACTLKTQTSLNAYNNLVLWDTAMTQGNNSVALNFGFNLSGGLLGEMDVQLNTMIANQTLTYFMANSPIPTVVNGGTGYNVYDIVDVQDDGVSTVPVRLYVSSVTGGVINPVPNPVSPFIPGLSAWDGGIYTVRPTLNVNFPTLCTGITCSGGSGAVLKYTGGFGKAVTGQLLNVGSAAFTHTITGAATLKNNAWDGHGSGSSVWTTFYGSVTCANGLNLGAPGVDDNFVAYDGTPITSHISNVAHGCN